MKPRAQSSSANALIIGGLLLALALVLTGFNLKAAFPQLGWHDLAQRAREGDLPAAIAFYSALPRIAVAMLCGAGLALCGTIYQQVLRNPLAEPSTLGVSSGAYLAVSALSWLLPGLGMPERILIAMAGAGLAMALVLILAWGHGLSVLALSLSGLTLNLVFGSLASIIITFHRNGMVSLSFWGSGALRQNDWGAAETLVFTLLPAAVALLPATRSLSLFSVEDEIMAGLGVSVRAFRLLALILATWIAAVIVACVGIIGFVGLAAPWLAHLFGARRMAARLLVSAMTGTALLLATDQLLIASGPMAQSIPAGSLTALLGAPVLLWLLRKPKATPPTAAAGASVFSIPRAPTMSAVLVLAILGMAAAMMIGRDAHGWHILDYDRFAKVLPWRWPRVLGSAAAGAALGIAGSSLQRLTANPMASPEVLGVSSGAILGALLAMFIASPDLPVTQDIGAVAGSGVVVALLALSARRGRSAAGHVLMVGIGLGTVLSAISSAIALLPDPRFQILQLWIVGSTDGISPLSAVFMAVVAMAGLGAACLLRRWQAMLQLGAPFAIAGGVAVGRAQMAMLMLVSVLCAIATLIVGPLSFIGLMAPHLAEKLGGRRVVSHLLLTAILGALIMVLADWLGRNLSFPYEIPAGLLATLIGGPYYLWLFHKRAT
ncbi:MAG: Fe(3+)-hydroxamate ABC transporter permease FhuB [Rhizobium sp.]